MDANRMLEGRYLKAEDLRGRRVEVTVERVQQATMRDGAKKLVLSFTGKQKQLPLNVTNLRAAIVALGGETDRWPGNTLTLEGRQVDFGGQQVDAIRIVGAPAPPAPRPAPPPEHFEATDDDVPF